MSDTETYTWKRGVTSSEAGRGIPAVKVYTYPGTAAADFVAVYGDQRIGFALTLSELASLVDTLQDAYQAATHDLATMRAVANVKHQDT